jgi:hypothetical protein
VGLAVISLSLSDGQVVKHGLYTAEAIEARRMITSLMRQPTN